jgi:hypothetical protein
MKETDFAKIWEKWTFWNMQATNKFEDIYVYNTNGSQAVSIKSIQ